MNGAGSRAGFLAVPGGAAARLGRTLAARIVAGTAWDAVGPRGTLLGRAIFSGLALRAWPLARVLTRDTGQSWVRVTDRRKRASDSRKNTEPMAARATNCGQTTSRPAPR